MCMQEKMRIRTLNYFFLLLSLFLLIFLISFLEISLVPIFWIFLSLSVQCSCSVVSDCNPMNCSTPGLPVHQQFLKSTQAHVILCHPLFLLPSIFPSFRVFSNELALCIRWPKYWSFSFNISPSMNTQDYLL